MTPDDLISAVINEINQKNDQIKTLTDENTQLKTTIADNHQEIADLQAEIAAGLIKDKEVDQPAIDAANQKAADAQAAATEAVNQLEAYKAQTEAKLAETQTNESQLVEQLKNLVIPAATPEPTPESTTV